MVVSEEAGSIDPWKKENLDFPNFLSQLNMENAGTLLDRMMEFLPFPHKSGSDFSAIFPILEEWMDIGDFDGYKYANKIYGNHIN